MVGIRVVRPWVLTARSTTYLPGEKHWRLLVQYGKFSPYCSDVLWLAAEFVYAFI